MRFLPMQRFCLRLLKLIMHSLGNFGCDVILKEALSHVRIHNASGILVEGLKIV
jgi:hypothetical protein